MSLLINESHANSKSIWVPKGTSYVVGSNFTTPTPLSGTSAVLYTSPSFTRNDSGTFVVSATWNFSGSVVNNFVPTIQLNGTTVVNNLFVNSSPIVAPYGTSCCQLHVEYVFANVPSTSYVLVFNATCSNTAGTPYGYITYTCNFYPS